MGFVWHMCVVCYMCAGTCIKRMEEAFKCLTSFLHLIPLRQNLSLNLELSWQPASPTDPPVSTPHSAEVIDTPDGTLGFLHGYWGLELKSSCSHNKPSTHPRGLNVLTDKNDNLNTCMSCTVTPHQNQRDQAVPKETS